MAGEPYWFEIGVADAPKARAFYGGLLGWEFETGPSGDDSAGAVIRTPGIDGGLHGGDEGASPYLFFRVDSMDGALERVAELLEDRTVALLCFEADPASCHRSVVAEHLQRLDRPVSVRHA